MRNFVRLLGLLRPYRGRLALSLACMVVYSAASTISLTLISPFLRLLFATAGSPPPAGSEGLPGGAALPAAAARTGGLLESARGVLELLIGSARPLVAFERLCLLILGLFLIKNLADYAASYFTVYVEQAAMRDARRRLFAHLQTLPLGFHHGERQGALMARLTSDIEALRGSLAAGISNLVKDGLTLIGCLVLVFAASWKLAMFSVLVVPPVGLALAAIGRKMRKRSGTAQQRMADLTGILQESLFGARVVKAFGMERFEEERFERANTGYFGAFVRLRRVSAAARPVSEYAIILVAVAIAWLGAREIFEHHTLPPDRFFMFVSALLATLSPVKSLSEVGATLAQGLGAADRVFGLLDTPSTITDEPGAPPLPAFRDAIRYDDVSFAYTASQPVLEHVSFTVRRGEVVALVGASGSGKSTTMDLLARFYDPVSGRVTVDGTDLRRVTMASLRAQLGIVTQETILFHDTVRAYIAYGRAEASDADVRRAAGAANAAAFIERLPDGYDTVIGDRGVRLSGGERQRLAIARALLKNPPILLLDEATSALDTESERLVQDALERLMRERTVLVIAHRLSTVQHADRIVVLERGRVVEEGRHEELLALGGVYRRLHDMQFRG